MVTILCYSLALLLGGGFLFYQNYSKDQVNKNITDFESCVKLQPGKPMTLIYPGQCTTPDGRKFIQPLSEEEKKKLIPPSGNNSGEICAQVITPAKNIKTNECKEFPTPCDVPEGWEKVEGCVDETANWKTYTHTNNLFTIRYPSNINIVINDETVKNVYGEYGISSGLGEKVENSQPKLIISIADKNTRNAIEYFNLVYNTSDNKNVPDYAAIKKRNFLVGGYQATETEDEIKEYGTVPYQYYRSVMINKKGNIINLGYSFGELGGKELYKKYKPIYEEVISTLTL